LVAVAVVELLRREAVVEVEVEAVDMELQPGHLVESTLSVMPRWNLEEAEAL
jgi:hypothetical protein